MWLASIRSVISLPPSLQSRSGSAKAGSKSLTGVSSETCRLCDKVTLELLASTREDDKAIFLDMERMRKMESLVTLFPSLPLWTLLWVYWVSGYHASVSLNFNVPLLNVKIGAGLEAWT